MKAAATFLLAAVACATAAATPVDLSATELRVPSGRLLVNLMMDGRLAWFSWMNRPELKPKLVVTWSAPDVTPVVLCLHSAAGDVRMSGAGGVLAIAEPQAGTIAVYR